VNERGAISSRTAWGFQPSVDADAAMKRNGRDVPDAAMAYFCLSLPQSCGWEPFDFLHSCRHRWMSSPSRYHITRGLST
jgi:hypothetical protein